MAEKHKPRVKAPKQRATHRPEEAAARRRQLLMLGGGGILALAAVFLLVVVLGVGGGDPSPSEVRAKLADAGCTLVAKNAQPGEHTLQADGKSKWNTDPPTSGPHFGFDQSGQQGTAIWGAYEEPLQLARVLHNLEHGGVFIFYGSKVKPAVIAELRRFYDDHQTGTLLAPYPKLGNKVALGAWVFHEEGNEKGYLAKCTKFDEGAYSAFFNGFQFKGPERFPSSSLLPGGN